jgi:hypothetical protein
MGAPKLPSADRGESYISPSQTVVIQRSIPILHIDSSELERNPPLT